MSGQQTDKDQKTEQPTPKKLRDSAKDGDLLQSKEFATALVMAAGAGWLLVSGEAMYDACENVVRRGLALDAGSLDSATFGVRAIALLGDLMFPMASLFLLALLASFAGPVLLGNLGFRLKPMQPKGSKLSPAKGLKRMFGMNGLNELGKSLAKAVLLGGIGYFLVAANVGLMVQLAAAPMQQAVASIGRSVLVASVAMAVGLFAIALVDVPVQNIMRTKRLRMTRQEVKDENKQTEGSPEVKLAQHNKRHEVLSRSARHAVKEAHVLLTNPTHFTVALRYDMERDAAPVVVGRGRGALAHAMRALAEQDQVPVLSYPELTRAIYFTSREGEEVSEELYVAVATILAFVFNLDRAIAEGRRRPEVEVPGSMRFDETGAPERPERPKVSLEDAVHSQDRNIGQQP